MPIIRQKPKTEPEANDFESAKARWLKVDAEWKTREREITSIGTALALANNLADCDSDRCEWARSIAGDNLALARKRPEKLRQRLEDLEYERDEMHPAHLREIEIWQGAQRRETTRQALLLQDRQKQAVKDIATALESLSRAISDERALHAELAAKAPLAHSPYLPDCSSELAGFGDLGHWNSTGSNWGKRMIKFGVLTND